MKPKIMSELYCPPGNGTLYNTALYAASQTALARMCDHFGGYTSVYGIGAWLHPDSLEIVHEDVHIIRVAIGPDQLDLMHSIAEQYKVESGEHTVMYSIGTEVFFI